MPVYRSAGVRASLKVGGEDLQESLIGEDGSTKGVMQFIGASKDLPFFMVEATRDPPSRAVTPTPSSHATRAGFGPPSSPLTALSTPNSSESRKDSLLLSPAQSFIIPQRGTARPLGVFGEFDYSLWNTIAQVDGQQQQTKQVLVEVFVNGQLVNANAPDLAFDEHADQQNQTGAWDFRGQWLYQHSESLPKSNYTAEERWTAAAANLRSEAADTSTSRAGKRPLSTEYLEALSAVPLPDRLRDKHNLGIMDIVITAVGDFVVHTRSSPTPEPEPETPSQSSFATRIEMDPMEGSFESPQKLPKLAPRKKPSTVQEPSPKKITPSDKTMALAKEYGLEDCLYQIIENYQNRRGQPGSKRSVYHRIVDIQRMSVKNRPDAMRTLKSQLAEQNRQQSQYLQKWRDVTTEEPRDSMAVANAKFYEGSSLRFSALKWAARRKEYVDCEEYQFITGMRFVVV